MKFNIPNTSWHTWQHTWSLEFCKAGWKVCSSCVQNKWCVLSTHSLSFGLVLCCERSSCCPSIVLRFAWNSLESSTSTSSWEESPLCFKIFKKKCDYLTCSAERYRRIENEEGSCLNISLGLDFRLIYTLTLFHFSNNQFTTFN